MMALWTRHSALDAPSLETEALRLKYVAGFCDTMFLKYGSGGGGWEGETLDLYSMRLESMIFV